MSPPRRALSPILFIALALIPLAACLFYIAIHILGAPAAIHAETFGARLPLQGPYTRAELDLAESQLLQFPTTQPLSPTTQQLHMLAEGGRQLERARQEVWRRRVEQRLDEALRRRPVAWVLISLATTLLTLWFVAAYRLLAGR